MFTFVHQILSFTGFETQSAKNIPKPYLEHRMTGVALHVVRGLVEVPDPGDVVLPVLPQVVPVVVDHHGRVPQHVPVTFVPLQDGRHDHHVVLPGLASQEGGRGAVLGGLCELAPRGLLARAEGERHVWRTTRHVTSTPGLFERLTPRLLEAEHVDSFGRRGRERPRGHLVEGAPLLRHRGPRLRGDLVLEEADSDDPRGPCLFALGGELVPHQVESRGGGKELPRGRELQLPEEMRGGYVRSVTVWRIFVTAMRASLAPTFELNVVLLVRAVKH